MINLILAASLAGSNLIPIPATPGRLRDAGFGVAAEIFIKPTESGHITVICKQDGCYLVPPKGVTF
ncbi:MAG: hypothetical protein GY938_20455 [Ketobacter sp.]|nr:hypothetical protein [Ketobacter sp.]